jgi:diguanylate cyclase (GGDEF)-like protein
MSACLQSGWLSPLLERNDEGLLVQDARSGRVVYCNERMAALLRGDAGDVVGRTDAELFDAATASAMCAAAQAALARPGAVESEHRVELGGVRLEVRVLQWATPADAAGVRWIFGIWTDLAPLRRHEAQLRTALEQVEQLQQANEELRRELAEQPLRDVASGLYNRSHFEDQLRREVDLSTREHREFAVVFIEIDPPADPVRALGRAAELRVLEALGRLLRSGTRAMDASCRYDERRFAVLLSGVGLATAHARMEGLRRQCATQIVLLDGNELGFTVSMGVASFPHTAHTQEELLDACRAALAEAQRRGGNHVTLAAIRFERG